jgi:NACalpha-BTF3-like transcription factor
MKTYQETKKKTPTEILYIEVIKKAFTDAFTIGTASDQSQSLAQSQAKNWFDISNKDFKLICEQAGTEPEYILKLYDNLQHNYNSGKITKEQLKFGISRLDKKI